MLSVLLDATTIYGNVQRRSLQLASTITPEEALDWVKNVNQFVLAGVAIVTGLLLCFWGGKLFKYLMFCVGFLFAGYGSYIFFNNYKDTWNLDVHVIQYICLGVGLLGGILCFCLYRVSLFLMGSIGSTILGQFLFKFIQNYVGDLGNQLWIQIVFVALVGLIGGLIMLKLAEWLMKPLTAFVGAFLMMASANFFYLAATCNNDHCTGFVDVVSFFGEKETYERCNGDNWMCYVSLGLWALFTLVGAYYQITQHPPWGEEEHYGRKNSNTEMYHRMDNNQAY